MIRLSCPHLTKAIDRFEYKENGIVRINAGLNETDNQDNFQPLAPPHHPPAQPVVEENLVPTAVAMRDHFRSINAHWKELKGELVSPEQYDILQARLGAIGAEHFLNSGLGGISPKKVGDVKCLHTHVADTILRGKSANRFGRWALKKIEEEQGVDPSGCDCTYYTAVALYYYTIVLYCLYYIILSSYYNTATILLYCTEYCLFFFVFLSYISYTLFSKIFIL